MLITKALIQRRVLHFTRWSRSSAAVFHSLGNVVTIGQLRANVLEQIAPKSSDALLRLRSGYEQISGAGDGKEEYSDGLPDGSLLGVWLTVTWLQLRLVATSDSTIAQPC